MSSDSDADAGEETSLWWGEPADALRHHVFRGKSRLARSLCGHWILTYHEGEPDVDPEGDTYQEGEDCKKCARRAGVLDEGSA